MNESRFADVQVQLLAVYRDTFELLLGALFVGVILVLLAQVALTLLSCWASMRVLRGEKVHPVETTTGVPRS